MFFPFISMFWMKMKEKDEIYYLFIAIHFFFSQNCINYPVSSVSWRINILTKKDHLYFSSEKRNICTFTKKVSFHWKSYFFDNFLLISLFFSNNKQKNTEYCHNIHFFPKKIINDVFFNVFRSINGILNKTSLYKYDICNLNKDENSA